MGTQGCPVAEWTCRGWSIDTAQWNYLLVQMGRIRWQDWMKMHYLQNFSLQINQGTLTWQSVFMTYLGNQCIGHFGIFLVLRPIILKSWHVSKPKIWRPCRRFAKKRCQNGNPDNPNLHECRDSIKSNYFGLSRRLGGVGPQIAA